jgi:phospholipid/cholesterol/gamma-HCH transport system ATP-binding protein
MIRLESISSHSKGIRPSRKFQPAFIKVAKLIIGRSGSGKTVLMKCIIGLLTPDSGEIFYENRALSSLNITQRSALRQEMGVVFQGGALFDSLTVDRI